MNRVATDAPEGLLVVLEPDAVDSELDTTADKIACDELVVPTPLLKMVDGEADPPTVPLSDSKALDDDAEDPKLLLATPVSRVEAVVEDMLAVLVATTDALAAPPNDAARLVGEDPNGNKPLFTLTDAGNVLESAESAVPEADGNNL